MTKLRRTVRVDTQRMRGKTLKNLEELFYMAKNLAQDEKMRLSVRQKWAQVAAYLAQVISSVAAGFDEKEIDAQLEELERLVNEAKAKTKAGRTKRPAPGAKAT